MDALTGSDLNGSPELFRLLADNIPQLAWITDADGCAFWYNRRWCDYTGLSLAEMEGWGWQSVLHPDRVEEIAGRFRQALQSGQAYEAVFPLRRHDGIFRDFLTRAEPIRDADGRITHWFGTNTDVTDQLATEQELREAEERVSLALAAGAIIGTWDWDLTCDRFTVDQQFAENFGLDPALGRTGLSLEQVIETVHPDDKEGLTAAIDEVIARGGPYAHQYRVRRRDGNYYWIEANGRVDYAEGKPARFPGVLLDLQERRRTEAARDRAEQALKQEKRRFEAVLDNTRMAVFLMDERQECVYANAAAEALTGYRFEQMQGRPLHDVIHNKKPDGSHYPLEECPIDRAFPERAQMDGEELFVAPDGSFYPVAFTASPVLDDGGKPVGTVIEARNIAEERERQAALAESEARFRTTAEALPGLLFVANAAGENIYVNQFYRDYTGLGDAVLGLDYAAAIHPDDVALLAETSRLARETGQELKVEYRMRRADGAYRWHSMTAAPTRDDEGNVQLWVGVSLDIHDRREAEDQARAAAEELEAIYATAPIGLTVLDRDLRYVRVNERLAEINGFPAADHIGRTVRELLPHIADVAEEGLRRVLQGEEVWGIDISGETPAKPGALRTWRQNWLPVRGSDGEITGIAISAEEVTEQKAAQLALARSEAQFRTVADALPGMLFITTASGGNSFVNETFSRYTGLPKEGLLGTGWAQTLHPDDVERGGQIWSESVRTGKPYEAEYRFRRHDGMYRWFAVRALRIEAEEAGAEEQWVGTCVDIHDRKLAEQELQQAESRYRAVFQQAGVGVARVSPDGPFLEINDRYCDILRRSREEILGGGWKHLTHPDDLAFDVAQVEKMLRGELDSYSIEKRYLAPDGSPIWVHLTVAAERDEEGRVLFFIPVVEDIGERKAAEEALRRSEERYRALFESMEQGFCTIQVTFEDGRPSDYRFTELNPAFTRQSGLAPDVLNRSVREAIPGLEQSWFQRYGEIAATGRSQRFIDHAEPLGRWFEVYAFRIGAADENNVAILFSDVTERIRQEEALRQSEQELRLRLNAIPQMVFSTRPDGFHDFYNDRWYEFTGTPLGSTDGEGWTGMFHPDDQPRAWERWKKSLATGDPYEIEYRLRHHDGSYRWVLGRALPIRNEAGEIVRWMGTCTDIDDRIAADRALRESEARLRAVIEAMPVGMVLADPTGRITGGNARVERLLGHPVLPSPDVDSYREWVAFHPDGRRVEGGEYPLGRVIRGEADAAEMEAEYQRGDGELRWIRFSAAAIRDGSGDLIGGVVASVDIDAEKRLTESLEREVEKVVAEREAAQEALRQSQKLEAMGQLTGGVAHDFNNLLTPIIGSLDLLQRKKILDERTGRLVDGALASAEKARVLVQRLLAFARRQPLQPQAVDLGRIVREMSDLIASTSGPRVKVEVDMPDDLPPALADGNQLEMALLNLSVNARDAMPDGGRLTIAVRSEPAGAGRRLGLGGAQHLVLSVSDTGIGMDEETRRRAIEPFFSTKGVGKGTGLGLSMVHGLAAQLGGALDIRSAAGVGTTIELWLPLADHEVDTATAEPPESERQGAGTALLVDDEELVRASTAGMLADLGYRVTEAQSGEAALALVQKGLKPDILVTDQLMPGLSGTDLAVRLREKQPALPVLIVSGYADLDSLSPSFPHLSKPFRQAELAAALEKMADG